MKAPRTLIFSAKKHGVAIFGRGHVLLGTAKTFNGMKRLARKIKLCDADIVMFSSSMDFPKEYTKDKTVLRLVKKLQTV